MNKSDAEFIALIKQQMNECCGKAPARCLGCWSAADVIAEVESRAA